MIDAQALQDWLRGPLQRADLAEQVAQWCADPALDDDLRLLHICHSLYPLAPAIWRGRPLDAAQIDAAAQAALAGSDEQAQWLASLADGAAFSFHERRGHAEVAELGQRWRAVRDDFDATWDAVLALGGPAEARPAPDQALAHAARVCFSEPYRQSLRRDAAGMLGPADWLARAPWFLQFGSDVQTMGEGRLEVLRSLDRASVLEEPTSEHLDALGQLPPDRLEDLRRRLLVSPLQAQSFHQLRLEPGAQELRLLPGEHHLPPACWTLGRAAGYRLAAVGQAARRALGAGGRAAWRFVRRRLRPAAAGAPASGPADEQQGGGPVPATPPATPDPPPATFEVRAIPVRVQVHGHEAPLPAYMARVSWSAPESLRARLHFATLQGWPSWPLLGVRRLPPQGQFLLLLFTSTRVQLMWQVSRRRWVWLWHWRSTPAADVWLPPMEALRRAPAGGALRRAHGKMLGGQHAPALKASAGQLKVDAQELLAAAPATLLRCSSDDALMRGGVTPRLARPLDRTELAIWRRLGRNPPRPILHRFLDLLRRT